MYKSFIKKGQIVLAVVFFIFAVLVSVTLGLTPWLQKYKNTAEQELSLLVGQPVTIQKMEASWHWFEPVIKLNQVSIKGINQHDLKFKKLLIGINLFRSLWNWRIEPGEIYIDSANLNLYEINNHWTIDGISKNIQEPSPTASSFTTTSLASLKNLLDDKKISIHNISAALHFANGKTLKIQDLNLNATNNFGNYHLKGYATLAQKIPSKISIAADLNLNNHAQLQNGKAYIGIENFFPAQWQSTFMPQSTYKIDSGNGNVSLWFEFANQDLKSLQANILAKDIAWHKDGALHSKKLIQSFQGNILYQPAKDKIKLTGDKIDLKMNGVTWPTNKFLLEYNPSLNKYHIFVQKLLVVPLLELDKQLTQKLLQGQAISKPKGTIEDFEAEIVNNNLNYLLMQFHNLSWLSNDKQLPSTSNLSGIFYWQPSEGKVTLKSKNSTVTFYKKPPIKFSTLETIFNWTKSNNITFFKLKSLKIQNNDLLLRANGTYEKPYTVSDNSPLNLKAQIEAKNAEQWLKYLPPGIMQAQFEDWIKQNIKKIKQINGQLQINGNFNDFPFDTTKGSWSFNSKLNGLDMAIAHNWPIIKDADGFLNLTKRNLELNLFNSELGGIKPQIIKIKLDNLGLNKETLKVHTEGQAKTDKVKNLLATIPLKNNNFSYLQKVLVSGSMDLDLNILLNLFENDGKIITDGHAKFYKDKIIVPALNNLAINDLSGNIIFDPANKNGILTAKVMDIPITVQVATAQNTTVNFKSTKQNLNGNLVFSNDSSASLLEGFLNFPDGKVSIKKAQNNTWDIDLTYKNNVNGKLNFNPDNFTVTGNIDKLILSSSMWENTINKNNISPAQIPNLDIVINELKYNDINLGKVDLKTASTNDTFLLKNILFTTPFYQLELNGNWKYNPKENIDKSELQAHFYTNNLAGVLNYWNMPQTIEAKRADILFKGKIDGGFFNISLNNLIGELVLELKNGRLTNLGSKTEKKLGIGKALSILSLQTIPRRLQLDFSDLSKQGYSFDNFTGQFKLTKGILHTTDTYIDGPVASSTIKGNIDLNTQTLNIKLRVSPHITSSLPVVATIAGGPIAGVATWVASKVLSHSMQKISSYTYNISGSWSDPKIQSVKK